MRELTADELDAVSGGLSFVDSVATGSAIGAVGYGGLTMAAGYSTAVVTAAFGAGAAVGGVLGGSFYIGYEGATLLGAGTLGGWMGTELAYAVAD